MNVGNGRTHGPAAAAPESADGAREAWIAAALAAFAVGVFAAREADQWGAASTIAALALFAGLAGSILSLSVGGWRERLHAIRCAQSVKLFAWPLALAGAIAVYSAAAGLPVAPRLAAFGAYLMVPAALVWSRGGPSATPARVLAAAVALWLPLEFDLLPRLRLPPPDGLRAAPLVAFAAGLYLFLVAAPFSGIGYTFRLRRREVGLALLAAAGFALVGVPAGLATGFLEWNPRFGWLTVAAAPVAIYLATAVPEEFLFRGLIQNALERSAGRAGLPLAAIIFGLAHLPDWRYVLLATFAGLAYGWVYARTRRITASAVTHAVVNWIWLLLLRG